MLKSGTKHLLADIEKSEFAQTHQERQPSTPGRRRATSKRLSGRYVVSHRVLPSQNAWDSSAPVRRAGLVISAPVFLPHQDCRRDATSRRRRRTGQATAATESWEEGLSLHLSRKGKHQRGKKETRPGKASVSAHIALLCGSCVLVRFGVVPSISKTRSLWVIARRRVCRRICWGGAALGCSSEASGSAAVRTESCTFTLLKQMTAHSSPVSLTSPVMVFG